MSLKFEVEFLTPFAISSGKALDGLDHTIDEETPFPSSAVKGLLRAHSLHWLGLPNPLVGEVFGTARKGSDWIFSDVAVERVGTGSLKHGVEPSLWNRVCVDENGRSEERALVAGQQCWAATGEFTISWDGRGEPPKLHVLVLRSAARDVVSIGLNRRRGFGWVTIRDAEPWTDDDSRTLLAVKEES